MHLNASSRIAVARGAVPAHASCPFVCSESKRPGAWVPALYGTFAVKGGHFIFFSLFSKGVILLFDPRREHSSVPTAIPLAVARRGGQGWRDSATRRACP